MRLHLDTQAAGTSHIARPVDTALASAAGKTGQATGGGLDTIGLSGASSALGKAHAQHAAKLASLATAVRSGQYTVSSSNVSRALLAHGAS